MLKVEDSNDATHTCETVTNTTVSGWQLLEFDFTNERPGTQPLYDGLDFGWTFNMASIFFNFGTEGYGETYYFDDVEFGESTVGTGPVLSGCTDSNASNFNPLANADDGSCHSITFLIEDFEDGINPNWDHFFQSGVNFSTATDGAPQGNSFYNMSGTCGWDWLIGMVNIPASAYGSPTFVELPENADKVYFNVLLNLPEGITNAKLLIRFKEDDNNDGVFTDGTDDTYSLWLDEYNLDYGWQQISVKYSDVPCLVGGNPATPGEANGNGIHNPDLINYIDILLLADPSTGFTQIDMDHIFFSEYYGCMDEQADNYNPHASQDDSTCIYYGCTDLVACNYNSEANTDDYSCLYPGQTEFFDFIEDHYNMNSFAQGTDLFSQGTSVFYQGTNMYTQGTSVFYQGTNIFTQGTATNIYLQGVNLFTQGTNLLFYGAEQVLETILNTIHSIFSLFDEENDFDCEGFGCTDPSANNYNTNAIQDNGSCEYTCVVPVEWETQNTGSNMTLMIPGNIDVSVNGAQLSGGSAIGVFYEDLFGALQCAGYTYLNGDTTHIAAMADDATTEEIDGLVPGTQMLWKIWDRVSCIEYSATAAFSMGSNTFALNGIAFVESVSYSCQDIEFPSGWFMLSTYIESEDMDVASVLSSLADNIIIVKNNIGEAYLPEWNFNGIGAIVNGQGYNIKLEENDQIEICGDYLIPESNPIELSAGWNTISYLRLEPANVEMIMESVVSNDNLIIVKDYNGNPYLPEWNYNGLGNMHPGQGYQLKINVADTLQYLSNDQEYRLPTVGVIENNVEHFTKAIPTGNNMQIVIPHDAWALKPHIGSEIAAFDLSGRMVGSGSYHNSNSVLTIWGDDETTHYKDGLYINDPFVLKLWKDGVVCDVEVTEWQEGSDEYYPDQIYVASSVLTSESKFGFGALESYPNPAENSTTISFFITEPEHVTIKIHNVLGEVIKEIVNQDFEGGQYEIPCELTELNSGTYFYTISVGYFQRTNKLIVTKQ